MCVAMKTSQLSKICKQQLLQFGDLELDIEGRRSRRHIRHEIKEPNGLFASLARGFKGQSKRWVGDDIVDSHGSGIDVQGCRPKVELVVKTPN